MRFDDMIATVLARPPERDDLVAVCWRQLVDLLAQRRGGDSDESRRAYTFLRDQRVRVSREIRQRSAKALSGRAVAPDLIAFFAEDTPQVAAPLIAGVRLEAEEWLGLLPRLGPSARALLRHRRDLPVEVMHALSVFGPSDFVIEGEVSPEPPRLAVASNGLSTQETAEPQHEPGESQIRELVERIEAYRRDRVAMPPAAGVLESDVEPLDSFRWETGIDGTIRWLDGAPRGPLIGQTIAVIAGPGDFGVDGQAAGAFEKRAPFRDARFRVPGHGPASGDWRISGVPFFDPQRGAFLGYRGSARRPRLHESAAPASVGVLGGNFPADSLRQLIHELRTPLNAIIGFSEMIEGQYLGPAALPYRERAGDITDHAQRLLSAVDDLDTAARIDSRRLELTDSTVDAAALLSGLHESYARIAGERGARLTLSIAPGLPAAAVEPAAAERMIARLLAATVGVAAEGDALTVTMDAAAPGARRRLCLTISRPAAIAGLGESALLDPGYTPDGDWPAAPVLGLGFALRLVRNLADAVGGELRIGMERIVLDLPAVAEAVHPETGHSESS